MHPSYLYRASLEVCMAPWIVEDSISDFESDISTEKDHKGNGSQSARVMNAVNFDFWRTG
jgi:hypothetical protein